MLLGKKKKYVYAFDWNVVWWWSCRDGGAGTAAPVMVLALQIEFSAPSLPVPCFRILQKKKKCMASSLRLLDSMVSTLIHTVFMP